MITAVDTTILLDIVADGAASSLPGRPSGGARSTPCGPDYDPVGPEAALHAGTAWRRYRAAGGPRTRAIADFLIASHALAQADRLLTRDRGFSRRYFEDLAIIDPSRA